MNTEEQIVLKQMIEIYRPIDIDWMGTKIKKNNPLTFHHIVKRKYGDTIVSNGALLTKKSHQLLNKLESRNKDLFDRWQWLFVEINCSNTYPSSAYLEEIKELRRETKEFLYGKQKTLKLQNNKI